MAYTAPPTKNPGDLITSALWDTYVLGNADSGFCRMIADVTLGAPAAIVDIGSPTPLPQTFAGLMVVILARGDTAALTTSLAMRLNNDSGANYEDFSLGGSGIGSRTSGRLGSGLVPAASATASLFGATVIWIPHYAQATSFKPYVSLGYYASSLTTQQGVDIYSGTWGAAAAAINRITFLPGAGNFAAGSRFTVYGLPA